MLRSLRAADCSKMCSDGEWPELCVTRGCTETGQTSFSGGELAPCEQQ